MTEKADRCNADVDKIRRVLEASADVQAADFDGLGTAVKIRIRRGKADMARLICVVHAGVDAQVLGQQVARAISVRPPRDWKTSAGKRAMVLCARSGFVRVMSLASAKPTDRGVPSIATIAHEFRVPSEKIRRGPAMTGPWS